MDFTGKIIAILSPRSGKSQATGNEWKVQEYVIESHEQYPKQMCFEVFGADKIASFNIQMGDELKVSFDINARQWKDRWFNSIRAWAVERVSPAQPASNDSAEPFPPSQPGSEGDKDPFLTASAGNESGNSNDDLPF